MKMNMPESNRTERCAFEQTTPELSKRVINARWLRDLCLRLGADDVGFVEIERESLADQREEILTVFPVARTIVCIAVRTLRHNLQWSRAAAYIENHFVCNKLELILRNSILALHEKGVDAMIAGAPGFPMEMENFPDRTWVISLKQVAVAAGLGRPGHHRCILHPKFGSYILLGSILIDTPVSAYNYPLAKSPCLGCGLCSQTCPVGAISPDGHFNFAACFTHNHYELMGGFLEWAEKLVDCRNSRQYRRSFSDLQAVTLWQSLSFAANYRSAYCCLACPAGEDTADEYLADKEAFVRKYIHPLKERRESIYVIKGADAQMHVAKHFPNKTAVAVAWKIRPRSIKGFFDGLTYLFQPNQSHGLNAVYHFTFTGHEKRLATVIIRNKQLEIKEGHVEKGDLHITADSRVWLDVIARRSSMWWAIVRFKIRAWGKFPLLVAFQKCFPL